jgi:hypothetical protein
MLILAAAKFNFIPEFLYEWFTHKPQARARSAPHFHANIPYVSLASNLFLALRLSQ